MSWVKMINGLLDLFNRAVSWYKSKELQAKHDELENDPNTFFDDHFASRVRPSDKSKTSGSSPDKD